MRNSENEWQGLKKYQELKEESQKIKMENLKLRERINTIELTKGDGIEVRNTLNTMQMPIRKIIEWSTKSCLMK